MPEVAFEDLALLVETSRRALRDKLLRAPERGPIYRPPGLIGHRGTIHVTIRDHGAVLARGASAETDVVDAAVAAGALAGQALLDRDAKRNRAEGRGRGDRLGLEFEWIGPREYLSDGFSVNGIWSKGLLHAFEGGLEGIGVVFGGKTGHVRPGQIIALNYSPDLALLAAERQVGLVLLDKQRRPDQIRYFRFPTYHLWQASGREVPVVLVRGESALASDSLTAEGLDAAIERMGRYLLYRQNSNGWFSYQFAPSRDRYLGGDSATAQMHALEAAGRFSAWSGQERARAALVRGARAASAQLMAARRRGEDGSPSSRPADPPSDGPERLVLSFAGRGDQLALSSRMLLVLSSLSTDKAFEAERRGLVDALCDGQRDDGRIEFRFSGDDVAREDIAAAGLALRALAQCGRPGDSSRAERFAHRALPYYKKKIAFVDAGREAGPRASAELARGFAASYAHTNEAAASDLVFELLDQFAALQLSAQNCPWPELHGAINVLERGAIGSDTAHYLTALCDGAALAERVGDRPRSRRYREAVRAGARFLLRLEFREAGAYYVRSPRDVLGGTRLSPWDNQVRIDRCAEALVAMIRARVILFGERE